MSPSFAVFLLMNNYFHDVATAMIMACCIILTMLVRRFERTPDPDVARLLLALYRGLAIIVSVSAAWLVVSGAIRISTLSIFEWASAADKGLTAGLVVKYVIASSMIVGGAVCWVILRKRVLEIRGRHVR